MTEREEFGSNGQHLATKVRVQISFCKLVERPQRVVQGTHRLTYLLQNFCSLHYSMSHPLQRAVFVILVLYNLQYESQMKEPNTIRKFAILNIKNRKKVFI